MSDDKKDDKIDIGAAFAELGRRLFGREVVLLFIFGGTVVGVTLYAAHAYAADMDKKIEPVKLELQQFKAEQSRKNDESDRRIRSAEIAALEAAANTKILVRTLTNQEPVELAHLVVDGGIP